MTSETQREAAEARRLAGVFEAEGQTLQALQQLDRVIDLGAADAEVWKDTGRLLLAHREPAQAIGAYRNAIELVPTDAQAHHELSRCFYTLGDVEQAAEHLQMATELCESVDPWLALATLAPSHPGFDHAKVLRVRETLGRKLAESRTETPGDSTLSEQAIPLRVSTSSQKKRIGFVSSWFDKANYMRPVWALINHLDRSKYEIYLLSDTAIDDGAAGYRSSSHDQIRLTNGLTNLELSALIQSSEIDLLIDLNAFSTAERLGLFSCPLPFRVAAWFNMYATSGLPGVDFIIGDDAVVRGDEEPFYSERVIRLPQSYLTFEVKHEAPPIVDPPCLDNGRVTFGSLVTQYKLNGLLLDSWAEILRRTSESQLLLGNAELDSQTSREFLIGRFAERGIEAERLIFRGRASHYEFLQYYNEIDVALDSFPYNGGTTTTEAIWQGVPVITFDGDRWASRTSASLLYQTQLKGWICGNREAYIDRAVQIAGRDDRNEYLLELRYSMRQQLLGSQVCDAVGFARAMESVFDQML